MRVFKLYASSDESIYKYLYNGKELQDELGLNIYAMDMRQYDPAIARWVVQDPVIHHSKSPYNAFDNNPVYWADPSGADGDSPILSMKERDYLPSLSMGRLISGSRNMDIYQDGGGGGTWKSIGGGRYENSETGEITSDWERAVGETVGMFGNGSSDGPGNPFKIMMELVEEGYSPSDAVLMVENAGKKASYSSGVIGLTQIGLLEIRKSLPLFHKIGTFSRFSSTYGNLGKFGGKLGTAGAIVAVGVNINDLNSGKIGVGRFAYRTGSVGASVATGATVGGPWGALGGLAVGIVLSSFEYIYDEALTPLWYETNKQIYNYEKALRHGWYPR